MQRRIKKRRAAQRRAEAQTAKQIATDAVVSRSGFRSGLSTAVDADTNELTVRLPGYEAGTEVEGILNFGQFPDKQPVLMWSPDGDLGRDSAALFISPFVSGDEETV